VSPVLRAAAFALTLLSPLAGFAADWSDDPDAPGYAASQSYRATQGAVAVRPLDNSAINLDIAKRIADALRQRGLTIADDAPLLLEFDTQTESNAPTGKRGVLQPLPRVDIGRERDLGRSDSVDARIDAYSTSRSSVLTGVRKPNISVHYSLRATLSERTGPRLWEGYTEYGELVSDESRLYATMAPLLASMVGQTTGERRFRVD
jgi:hypothetical protein